MIAEAEGGPVEDAFKIARWLGEDRTSTDRRGSAYASGVYAHADIGGYKHPLEDTRLSEETVLSHIRLCQDGVCCVTRIHTVNIHTAQKLALAEDDYRPACHERAITRTNGDHKHPAALPPSPSLEARQMKMVRQRSHHVGLQGQRISREDAKAG